MSLNLVNAQTPPKVPSDVAAAGGAGLRAFANIAEAWGLSVAEQLTLLGIASRSTFFKWRRERQPRLPQDTLERLSYLLGIYKSLQILLPDTRAADEWVRKPNEAAPFGGRIERIGRVARRQRDRPRQRVELCLCHRPLETQPGGLFPPDHTAVRERQVADLYVVRQYLDAQRG